MVGLQVKDVVTELENGYLAPSCEAEGPVRSALFHPDGYSLWELEAELAAGSALRWGADHADEAVFVLDGELALDGTACDPKTAVIIEAGVPATVRAVSDARILHFGPTEAEAPIDGLLGPALGVGHQVHVVDADDAPQVGSGDGPGAVYYADSSCPTCRIALFEVHCGTPHVVSSHTHSEDEIIRVMTGELRVGRVTVTAGMSIAVPGELRYGFRTPGPYSFLNYRRDASLYVGTPGSPPILEGAEASRRMASGQELG
ncbi:MAG TPA: hypothetical protein VHX40_08150 [Acidimicrobiales bacterium]|nr:hypothetical protein [Acidimicrobiales bacterium]